MTVNLNTNPKQEVESKIDISAFQGKSVVHTNLDNEYLILTEDKLKLCLMNNKSKLQSKFDWIGPLGIIITLSSTLFATTFKDTGFITAESWATIFVLLTIVSILWFVFTLVNLYKNRSKDPIAEIITELKNNK